ncbi:MAG: DUF3303 domain-containing protein [Thermoguttaceae bacterium]
MKFIMTFSWKPDPKIRDEAISRFQKVGAYPPQGVKLLARWSRADLSGGYDLLESDDAKALAELALLWCDLMELQISPVLEDMEMAKVFKRSGRARRPRKRADR